MPTQEMTKSQTPTNLLDDVLKIKVPPLPPGLRNKKLRAQMLRETIASLKSKQ